MQPQASDDQPPQQPVAYDADGNPLYAAPPSVSPQSQPAAVQVVHMARSVEPQVVSVSPEIKRRHEESMRKYPTLNLSDHEYVVTAIHRHPIGMLGVVIITAFCIAIVMTLMLNFVYIAEMLNISTSRMGLALLAGVLLVVLFLIGGYVAIWVYLNNRFFLTNESVIQEIQVSLFTKTEQTVSLMNIEDASYDQKGPLQSLLDYGSIRLSTEGEETTYRFYYVANPKRAIAVLNNAVEAFKNGRPVDGEVVHGDT